MQYATANLEVRGRCRPSACSQCVGDGDVRTVHYVTESTPPPRFSRARLRTITRRLNPHDSLSGWIFSSARSFMVSFVALSVTFRVLPGEQVTRGAVSVAALAMVVLLLGAVIQPPIARLTALTGWVGLAIAGLLTQAVVLGIALAVVPTVQPFRFSEVFVAAWASAVVAALVNWLFDSSTEEVFFSQVLGQAIRTARRHPRSGPGLLVVQLDGVSEPILRMAMTSGAMPAVSRLLRSDSHRLRHWHTGLPATTPAGQAVLLHGDEHTIPGYRWYDKDQERIIACGRAGDVARIQEQISDGHGLLAYDGASVSNMFSGDAPVRTLTVSDPIAPVRDRGAVSYAVGRSGFARSMVLFVGQVIAEWFQGRRQRRRDVQPRVSRSGAFLFLRGITTVLLRDMNVSVVAQQMARGAPVIYVDFVDYDEVAHHAGPSRPETIRTLESLDRIVEFFMDVNAEVGRDYEIALVSDHGQSQGTPFRQLNHRTLTTAISELTAHASAGSASEYTGEPWMPANLLLAGAEPRNPLAQAARRVANRKQPRVDKNETVRVMAGGSLAHVYFTDIAGPADADDVSGRFPGMIDQLTQLPGVGVVVVRNSRTDGQGARGGAGQNVAHGAVTAIGRDGRCELGPDGSILVDGHDPLLVYGAHAHHDVGALFGRENVGDLVLLGEFDEHLGEVTAFEELVGSHGGLGGWQTRALLIHPNAWDIPDAPLDGKLVYTTMIGRLADLGLRGADGR